MKRRKQIRLPYESYKQGVFHITLVSENRIPIFAYLDEQHSLQLTPCGQYLERMLNAIVINFHDVSIIEKIVMPEHIHLLIKIHKPNSRNHLHKIIHWYKIKTQAFYRYAIEELNWPNYSHLLWHFRCNDEKIYHEHDIHKVAAYIRNNPKRLIEKLRMQ